MSVCLHEIDPELSASTGLTNDVCGRLAIFSAPVCESSCEDSASALPTPSKKGETSDEEGQSSDEERQIYAARDQYLSTLAGKSTQEKKMCIGERLYYVIAEEQPEMAGKLTGMFLEATANVEDLALLLYSPSSLKLLLTQALDVLSGLGLKRSHPKGGSRQYPFNAKKARVDSSRPFFAEITDDSGKRTRVPCRYDAVSRMYVPSGGRDTVPCGKKVGTRDKTPQDLQALELGETDEGKLRARRKQINIGQKTEGYRRLIALGMSGRALQDVLGLPYMTEDGALALTLVCSKKRYDGYLRIWKRKLYEFAALQRLNFSAAAPPAAAAAGSEAIPFAAGESHDGAGFRAAAVAIAAAAAETKPSEGEARGAAGGGSIAARPAGSWAARVAAGAGAAAAAAAGGKADACR